MKILITAGGTREDIDTVRGITNYSTGRLGSLIADCFLKNGCQVTYICGEGSALPNFTNRSNSQEFQTLQTLQNSQKNGGNFTKIQIRSTAQLLEKLEHVLTETSFDAVIHSMAVSDYAPHAIMPFGEENHGNNEDNKLDIMQDIKKISSSAPYLAMILKRQPKVIARIKVLQPETLLVGFKLLSGVDEAELVQAALKLLEKNRCGYVLANDLQNIKGDTHNALLLNKNGIYSRLNTKHEIADKIYNVVKEWYR